MSTTTFKKGLKKGETVYLAYLFEVKPDVYIEVPDSFAKWLAEFKDVMLLELPEEFPPKRKINSRIDLIPGSMPLTYPLYHMSLLELAELTKQLVELLETELIQPLKAPYGAPILFQKSKMDADVC